MKKMKILYISTPHFLDTDLMLLQQLKHHVNINYLLDVANYSRKSTLLNMEKKIKKNGLFTFTEKTDLFPYFFKKYINYNKSNVILRSSKKSYHYSNILLQFKIDKLIKKVNPDLIHINNSLSINYIYLYMRIKKYKNVLTIHDPIAHTGEYNSRTDFVKKVMIKNAEKIILLNSQSTKEFMDRYKVKEDKISITGLAPYFVYNKFNHKDTSELENNILFFGRISPYKGIRYLIEASKLAKKKIPNLEVTIAGKGDFGFDVSRIKKDKTFNLINRFIENEELVELISSHSLIVCPYTDATQSGVLMTAFAFYKPVIATDVGNFSEIIKDNITGLIVPPKNSQKLAEAIVKIFSTPHLIENMNNNIKNDRCVGSKSWDIIAEKTYEIYKSVSEVE